jgi:serine/threonine-protein kinase
LAYTSGGSGTPQVFVKPFANGKIAGRGVWPVSPPGGAYPVWSSAARQLLYATSEGRIMVVDYIEEGESFHALKSRPWSEHQIGTIPGNALDLREGASGMLRLFDLTPDGKTIIGWEPEEQPKEPRADLHMTMLLNWFDEVRRRVPVSGK